jgi:diguanylate cyclase (GGDEF)-like protein
LTETFKNSYVYRVGGDEFAVILDGDDYNNREALLKTLETKSVGSFIRTNEGEKIPASFAFGMASYAKELDAGFDDVLKHADSAMYLHKRALKRSQLQAEQNNPQ